MTYKEVLDGTYKLVFKHAVLKPTTSPDLEVNSMKLWVVDDGLICISPARSFPFGNSRFIFPYAVSGEIAYLCTFEEMQPASYRTPRHSGTVQISTNKRPVPIRKAIAIIWKEINKSVKYHSRITPQTKRVFGYVSNSVFNAAGGFKPYHVYNRTVYVLYVDFKSLRAEYKPLISQQDIMKLYSFVDSQNDIGWSEAFGFTRKDFISILSL